MEKPTTISELVDFLEENPSVPRSVTCLHCFIRGWRVAIWNELPQGGYELLLRFQEMLQKKHNLNKSVPWDRILLLYSQDECDAYERFFKEFKQFRESQRIAGSGTADKAAIQQVSEGDCPNESCRVNCPDSDT